MKVTVIDTKLFVRLQFLAIGLLLVNIMFFSGCSSHKCTVGEWVVTKNASYLDSGEKTRYCTECEAAIDVSTFELTSYVENGEFIFSPDEFTSKLNDCLYDANGEYSAIIGTRDEDNVVASCIFRDSGDSGVCHITFLEGDDMFTGESSRTKTGTTSLVVFFDDSCEDEELSDVLPSIVQSLSPVLSMDDAITLSNSIIEKSENSGVTEDGILYRLIDVEGIMESKWWLYIMLSEN